MNSFLNKIPRFTFFILVFYLVIQLARSEKKAKGKNLSINNFDVIFIYLLYRYIKLKAESK